MTLKLHHLRPAPGAKKAKTRVGRGEGSKGKTAGRGTKGTKARYQVPVGFEGGQIPIHMRLPKLKGFKNPFREEYQVVNVERLGTLFPKGGKVDVDALVALVRSARTVPSRCSAAATSRRGPGLRAPLLRVRQEQDRGGRRQRHRALTNPSKRPQRSPRRARSPHGLGC